MVAGDVEGAYWARIASGSGRRVHYKLLRRRVVLRVGQIYY